MPLNQNVISLFGLPMKTSFVVGIIVIPSGDALVFDFSLHLLLFFFPHLFTQ